MADTEQNDDLRSALANAIETTPPDEVRVDTPAPPEAEERETPATEAALSADAAPEKEAEPADAAAPKEEKPLDPHANWSKEDKEHFAKLDKTSQEFLLGRERSMEADYTRKTQAVAALKRDYEPVDKLFEPYRGQMKSAGHSPFSLIQGWANVETALMQGKGIDVINGLVRGYKIDPKAVIAALSGAPPAAPSADGKTEQQPPAPAAELSPEIKAKLAKIDTFEARFSAEDRARADAETARVSKSIEDFKSAKDDKGAAKHPHFDEVEADMTQLALVVKAQGGVPDLKQLYESAVYANPSTRAKVLAAEKQSEQEKAKAEARAKAEKARKASGSVTGSPTGNAGQPLPNGRDTGMSLRDQIAESVDNLAG